MFACDIFLLRSKVFFFLIDSYLHNEHIQYFIKDMWPGGLARWLVDFERTVVGSIPAEAKTVIVISCTICKGV